jgi:hypothetical protein
MDFECMLMLLKAASQRFREGRLHAMAGLLLRNRWLKAAARRWRQVRERRAAFAPSPPPRWESDSGRETPPEYREDLPEEADNEVLAPSSESDSCESPCEYCEDLPEEADNEVLAPRLEVSPWLVQQFPNFSPEYLRQLDELYDEDIPIEICQALRACNDAWDILPQFP